MQKEKPVVAAFDFDGTITYSDTFFFFFFYAAGFWKGLFLGARLLPSFVSFFCGRLSREGLKERALTLFFRGERLDRLEKIGLSYMREKLPSRLRSEALRRIEHHRRRGDRLLLVSASLDLYLRPWAERHGFDDLLCTSLEVDSSGRVSGRIDGKNCRGQEKVERIRRLLGPKEGYLLYAYGDSEGDRELLDYADKPFYRPF